MPVTLLVNSSDGFNDCWEPYFSFLKTYWPEMDWPVLLNTETAEFTNPSFDITSSKVALGEESRLSWSECLIRAIVQVRTPIILYMQEDYFLNRKVDDAKVREAVQLMLENEEVAHIGLTKHGSHGPFAKSHHKGFGVIPRKARYRISTQAGLWRPQSLMSYLRSPENGWMFEIYGTWRAQKDDSLFLTASFDEAPAPIDYVHTGIIKGQWHEAMPAQFALHGVPMCFDERGIYHAPPGLLQKWGVIRKLIREPRYALNQLVARYLR